MEHRYCYPHAVEIVNPRALRSTDRFAADGPSAAVVQPQSKMSVVAVREAPLRQAPSQR